MRDRYATLPLLTLANEAAIRLAKFYRLDLRAKEIRTFVADTLRGDPALEKPPAEASVEDLDRIALAVLNMVRDIRHEIAAA